MRLHFDFYGDSGDFLFYMVVDKISFLFLKGSTRFHSYEFGGPRSTEIERNLGLQKFEKKTTTTTLY